MAPETQRTVSTRLLTMKFMQRAIASGSFSGNSESDTPSKKRKLDGSCGQDRFDTQIDQAIIQAALDNQEAMRQAALEQHSSANTHWTLEDAYHIDESIKNEPSSLNIVSVGYGSIDWLNESNFNEQTPATGRIQTKKYQKENQEQKHDLTDEDSESQISGDSRESQCKWKSRCSSEEAAVLLDGSRSQARPMRSEGLGTKEFRNKQKKEIRLDQITSISSGGTAGNHLQVAKHSHAKLANSPGTRQQNVLSAIHGGYRGALETHPSWKKKVCDTGTS